jgi:predicted phosphoribosyltransferase
LRFQDRVHAGKVLAGMLRGLAGRDCTVLAIPNGGVPVGIQIAGALGADIGVEFVRKLQVPGNTEAGFGAVTSQGDVILNQFLVRALRLGRDRIRQIASATLEEIRRRQREFGNAEPAIEKRTAILTDDGLASGFTMVAAARSVRRRGPDKIVVAVPTAHFESVGRVQKVVDRVVCPDVRRGPSFAVADAYEDWYDLTTAETADMLREHLASRMPPHA